MNILTKPLWTTRGGSTKIFGGNAHYVEAPKTPSGWSIKKVSSPQPTRVLEERRELTHGVRGWAPVGNGFWRILKAIERSFLHLYADALSSSNSVLCHIWGRAAKPRFGAMSECRTALVYNIIPRCRLTDFAVLRLEFTLNLSVNFTVYRHQFFAMRCHVVVLAFQPYVVQAVNNTSHYNALANRTSAVYNTMLLLLQLLFLLSFSSYYYYFNF